MQDASYKEVRVWAFDRAKISAGAPVRSIVVDLNTTHYDGLLPGNMRGARRRPAERKSSSPNRKRSSRSTCGSSTWTGSTPANSTFDGPTDVSQAGYNFAVSVLSHRRHARLARRSDDVQNQYHEVGGAESLWVNHTVRSGGRERQTGSSGRRSMSPAARSFPRPCSSRSTGTSAETACTAGWAAWRSIAGATWRWATACRARAEPGNPVHRPAGRRPARHAAAGESDGPTGWGRQTPGSIAGATTAR